MTKIRYVFILLCCVAAKELTYYMDLEHANVTYYNRKYYQFFNVTSRRYSRRDPIHYVNVHFQTLVDLGRNVTLDAYFYEFLSNEYRRSFIEMHVNACDFIYKEKFFGSLFNNVINIKDCRFPKGIYHWMNFSIPNLPILRTFPFQKSRLYISLNLTTGELLASGYADANIKTRFI